MNTARRQPAERVRELTCNARRLRLGEHVARECVELARAHRHSEELLRDVRQLMRLVDDHRVGAGQQLAESAFLEREIREQQMMVHDHDVGGLRFAARFEHEAAVEELAVVAEAVVDGRRDGGAQRVILGRVLELGEIAARARSAPRGVAPSSATVAASRVPSCSAVSSRCQQR